VCFNIAYVFSTSKQLGDVHIDWYLTGGVMMSLFWYYRPEDAKGTNISDYHEVL